MEKNKENDQKHLSMFLFLFIETITLINFQDFNETYKENQQIVDMQQWVLED